MQLNVDQNPQSEYKLESRILGWVKKAAGKVGKYVKVVTSIAGALGNQFGALGNGFSNVAGALGGSGGYGGYNNYYGKKWKNIY